MYLTTFVSFHNILQFALINKKIWMSGEERRIEDKILAKTGGSGGLENIYPYPELRLPTYQWVPHSYSAPLVDIMWWVLYATHTHVHTDSTRDSAWRGLLTVGDGDKFYGERVDNPPTYLLHHFTTPVERQRR